MVLYTMGIAACASNNIEMLVASCTYPTTAFRGQRVPFVAVVEWVEDQRRFKVLAAHECHHFPASEWLFVECRDALRPVIPDDRNYDDLFDRFEILRSLAALSEDKSHVRWSLP